MKNRFARAGAAVVVAAGLTFGAAAPAQAFSWFGPGYTYPSHSEWSVPACQGTGEFGSFFNRNFNSHIGDLNNFSATANDIYSNTFSSPKGFLTSVAYTVTQPINFLAYPTLDLVGHGQATAQSSC